MSVGLKRVGSLVGSAGPLLNNGTVDVRVKANTTITKGDPVNLEAGFVNLAAAGEKIFGVANQTVAGNAGGTSKIEIIVAVDTDLYLIDNDNDSATFANTHVGTYFDIISSTGAVQVDTDSTTTTGQLLCVDYNPQGHGVDSDISQGLFTIAELQIGSGHTV